jgi:two-component system, NtrC family, response regulator HydG
VGTKRILVVDDEPGLRVTLAANLEVEGFEVVEASDAIRALALFRESPFDLVITDVRMPGMSGVELFRELRKIRPDVIVVLMTGFARENLVEEALSNGAYTLIVKPFAVDHVIALVSRAMERQLVLVVDDAAGNAASLVQALRSVGLEAEAEHDGAIALQRVASGRKVDVCVLELVLGGKAAIDTFESIRTADRGVLVIGMARDAVPQLMHALMTGGGYTCLREPFEVSELVQAIARGRAHVARGAGSRKGAR